MQVASEQNRPRTDREVIEAAIEQLQAVSKDKKGRATVKKVLGEHADFLSALRRCLLSGQTPLEVVIRVGPDIIFKALTQDVPIQDVQEIETRLRTTDTEDARELRISLIAYLIGVGCKLDADCICATREVSLPLYAASFASGLITDLHKRLEDDNLLEYQKRTLASILVLALPRLKVSETHALSIIPSTIRSLRNSQVDPRLFSPKVIERWTDRLGHLPSNVASELAQVLSERPDGYQMRFWDDKKLGPLSALLSERQTPPGHSAALPKAEKLTPVDIQPEAVQPTTHREKPRPEPHMHLQSGSGGSHLAAGSPESPGPQFPSFLKWLSELHAELGAVLQIATENVQLKQQLLEIQQTLTSAENSREEAVQQLKAGEAAAAETETNLGRLRKLHEEDSVALTKERSRSDSLERRIADLETLGIDAEKRIASLKAELDEASRFRILYGEQRATELKNRLREKISAEVSGLPTLGPELSQDSFSMLRVRFRNLLKLLHDSGLLHCLPGEPGR